MSIIHKKAIFPIIIPTEDYIDRFGNPNNFIEMNPSIYISNNGEYSILVRTVNYLKYKNNKFTVYGNCSTTKYYIMRGIITDGNLNLDSTTIQKLETVYNIQRSTSLWYGIEDVRFVDRNTILACIPECNNGSPGIFKAILRDNILTSFEKCSPSKIEKNWMPYIDSSVNKQRVIYSVMPFIIKSIQIDDREEIELDEKQRQDLSGWHGSSNGIDMFGQKLFLIHKNKDRVYNRWLLFDNNNRKVYYSSEFVFFKDSYIEFVCSLQEYDNRIYVSLGINDNKAFIIELDQYDIMKLFV